VVREAASSAQSEAAGPSEAREQALARRLGLADLHAGSYVNAVFAAISHRVARA